MKRDERGYIVVETIGSFLLFVLLITSILSIINIVTIQARIHYAVTQTAETLSMYDYVLHVTGADTHLKNSSAKAGKVQGQIDEMKGNINDVISGIERLQPKEIGTAGKAAVNQAKGWMDQAEADPEGMIQDVLNYALNQGGNAAFGTMLRPLVGHYLTNNGMSGDEYLRTFRVIDGLEGLEFYDFSTFDLTKQGNTGSTFMDQDGNIRIRVEYDVDYTFGALMIPFKEPKLHITQIVQTKAWLGGLGEGYTK